MRHALIVILLTITGTPALSADNTDTNPDAASKGSKESPARGQMNRLIKESLGLAVKTINNNEGGIYPYGMTMNQEGQVSLKGYQGNSDDAPPQDQWVKSLTQALRKATSSNADTMAASITRLDQIENDQGKTVPGIWVLADHRNNRPWIAFFPLAEKDNGEREVGDPAYQATDQWLFSEESGADESSGKAKD